MSQIFGGVLQNQIVCKICNMKSCRYDPYMDVSMCIEDCQSVM